MESLDHIRNTIADVLQAQIGSYPVDSLRDELVQSKDLNRFLVIRTGWHRDIDHYALIQDVLLRPDGSVVIYADNTNENLAEDLVDAGIPAATIVKAYDPEAVQRLNEAKPQSETNPQRQAA